MIHGYSFAFVALRLLYLNKTLIHVYLKKSIAALQRKQIYFLGQQTNTAQPCGPFFPS